jgi:hypothetical protein
LQGHALVDKGTRGRASSNDRVSHFHHHRQIKRFHRLMDFHGVKKNQSDRKLAVTGMGPREIAPVAEML